jgi:glycosyltransferase involved in cell wall biosynthesis
MALEISVIVPTYNRADLIAETLASILNQSHRPSEIIVVDDGSRDNTEAIVREFGSQIKYVRIDNSGECRARNVGVSAASAPWIAFCDSDDLWHPDKLLLQARLFERASDVEYSFTNFKTVVDAEWSGTTKFDTSPTGYWDLPRREIADGTFVVQAPMCACILRHQPIFPSTLMMKRSFFDRIGQWRESLGRTPSVDLEFHFRCVSQPLIGVVSTPVVGIRKHASNFSGNPLRTTIGEVEILRYILSNVPAAREHEDQIREEIIARGARTAEDAFAIGDLELARQLLESVPYDKRSWKLRVKSHVLQLPKPVGQFLQKRLVRARA